MAEQAADAVVVTPDMILKFAAQLRDSAAPLQDVDHALASINGISPGNFPDGNDLQTLIGSGREGRVKLASDNSLLIQKQLERLANKLEQIARKYTNTDELNKNLVKELGPLLGSLSPQGGNLIPNFDPTGGAGNTSLNPGGSATDMKNPGQ
ncbi:hypothetical protein [Streptomyces chartreusis]